MLYRPYGVVIGGRLQIGLELEVVDHHIVKLGPHTGLPEPYVVSPAFVNAHSHMEYRGMLGLIEAEGYSQWIREITRLKKDQPPQQIEADCLQAAKENRATGVARIGEHSDRVGAATALSANGIDGILFQELITFFEHESPEAKLVGVLEKAAAQAKDFVGEVAIAPHAPYTVDKVSLRRLLEMGKPLSIHVAESGAENEFFRSGIGPIADFYKASGVPFELAGGSAVQYLIGLGFGRPTVQFVHCCDVDQADIEKMAKGGIKVAHCPRSNARLGCPPAPVREMLDAGIDVGLGLDSAASSGPIDMFAEMRGALDTALNRRRAISPEVVWSMATTMGNRSLPFGKPQPNWDIYEGSATPLIKIHVEGPQSTEDLIANGSPDKVEWL